MPALAPTDLGTKAAEVVKGVNPHGLIDTIEFRGEITLVVNKRWILPVIRALRDNAELSFNMLSDVNAVDYLELGRTPRFDVVYHLYSIDHHHRIRLRAPVGEEPEECEIESVCGMWAGASFMERETWDMFGIRFNNHPDLRRILMPDDWEGHPLRKDFPLGGSTSFYYKQDTNEYAGEPKDLIPRIRVQDSDV